MNTKIGVVHGGVGNERDKSIKYGQQVSKIFKNLGMDVLEMHLHPNGSWTVDGRVENIEESIKKVDKVWNCLVGDDGEGGVVEHLCTKCKVKVVGHSPLHANLCHDKKNLSLALLQHKIKTPFGKVVYKKDFTTEKILEIFSTVGVPSVVKPNMGSGMWGVTAVNNFQELKESVEYLISKNQDVLVEKVVKGIPVSCFVFEHNNLLHTHIKVFVNDGDYTLSNDDMMHIRNEALFIHNVLAFSHHAEYDFILSPKGLYFLETNSHPSLTTGYIQDVFKNGIVSLADYLQAKVSS